MIHYHGTPIGGSRQDTARFLRGRHALVPHFYQDDLGAVADVCASFIFDVSAYTVWKQGGEIDVPGYTKMVESYRFHPGFDWAIIPDVIGGTELENDAMIRDWPVHLRSRGVPVWHLDEGFERLEALVVAWPTIALGSSGEWGSPGSRKWWERMRKVMGVVCDAQGRPRANLHGLRMLDPEIFTRLPLRSADSTNAAVNSGSLSRFGMYLPPTTSQRAAIIAERIEAHNSAPLWIKGLHQEDIFDE